MKHTPYPVNFIYPENIHPKTYTLGGGQISEPDLRVDGDWRGSLPVIEDQNKFGVESSACYIEAQQHAVATVQKAVFGLNSNYAARFNALLSNGTSYGGDPIAGAESIRTDGLIPDTAMPFGDSIASWEEYHSWEGVVEAVCRKLGKDFLNEWELKYHVIFERWETLETKYKKLKDSLKKGPVCVSVYAWVEIDGLYVKPEGASDTHLTEITYVDSDGCAYTRDTYDPYEKKIAPNTNFDFAIQWFVKKRTTKQTNWFIRLIKRLWQK